MVGDAGPYVDPNGPDVWVPRTVPYLEARKVAKEAAQYGERLAYIGKTDAILFGFTRDCRCDEVCELAGRCRSCGVQESWCECENPDPEDWDVCLAPAWRFRLEED